MKFHNIIIGAGISGLALGWFLKKHFEDQSLTILEASDRVGGWIRSHREQGFLFEEGPRSCRSKGAGLDTLQLIEDLDLCEEVISASPAAKKRFIYSDGKLQAVPNSFFSFLLSPLMKGVLPALCKEWHIPPSHLEDESIADFVSRRFSKNIASKLMDPLVSGIYAGDISKLSLRSCFPEMHRLEQEHGSMLKGMLRKKCMKNDKSPFLEAMRKSSIFSFVDGMETLTSSLHAQLGNVVRLSTGAKSLKIVHDAVEVSLHSGEVLQGDRVFLAIPAFAAAQLLQTVDRGLSEEMDKTVYASVAVVNMGWNQKVLKQEGFGYLIPSSEKQDVLGIVFDSCALAQQNSHDNETRLTAMLGGMHRPEIERFSLDEIKGKTYSALNRHLNITDPPQAVRVSIAKQAIPQYEVGHQVRFNLIKSRLDHLSNARISLLGSAFRGVSVNDCIAEAKKIAAINP